jgi:phytanoyl-CoA hydroxylase
MQTTVTPDQIESYQDNGFLIYRNLLSAEELAEFTAAVLDAISSMGKRKIIDGPKMEEGDTFYDRVFIQRLNLWQISDTVKRFLHSPELGKMAAQLAGVDGVRIWHDQALIKEPFANPSAFHLDCPSWPFSSRDAVSIWIALADATVENGCMFFLPGTHKGAEFDRNAAFGPEMAGLLTVYPEWREIEPVPVALKAGDCSFHNGLLAHGANANMTLTRRSAMTAAFMPDGSTFNGFQGTLPDDYFKTLTVGDVLNNEDQNPLVYSSVIAGDAAES